MRYKLLPVLAAALVALAACGGGDGADPNIDSDLDGIPDISDLFPFDTDNDGLDNDADADDDGDGVADADDAFPFNAAEWLDTDGDGKGNNFDSDDDGDGVPDSEDRFPLGRDEWADSDGDGAGDNADSDDDGDGVPDIYDASARDAGASGDIDGDGLDSLVDGDDDGDGYPDDIERGEGTNPFDASSRPADSDGDGLTDNQESSLGTDAARADSDSDGLDDPTELKVGSNPVSADSDADFKPDGLELGADYDGDGTDDVLDFSHLITLYVAEGPCAGVADRFGAAWNGEGDVAVARNDAGEVVVYSRYGDKRMSFGKGILNKPNDVAVDGGGNYYAVDSAEGKIFKFSGRGAHVGTIGGFGVRLGEFSFPRGIDMDDAGNIYIADTENNRIQIMDPGGSSASAFGSLGRGSLNFSSPVDVAVGRDGRIYVADRGNYRVMVFSMGLPPAFVRAIDHSTLGLERATDFEPVGLAVSDDGALYVLNIAEPYVAVVSADGSNARTFGSNGGDEGEYLCPSGMDVGGGKIVVSEETRIQIF